MKTLTDNELKEEILEYYKTHDIVYPSDIAFEKNYELKRVVRIISELLNEGKVKEVV